MSWETLFKQFGLDTPFGYGAMAFAVFVSLDKGLSDDAKNALAKMMSVRKYNESEVAAAIVEVFDRFYTQPLFHWRAFVRSTLFTLGVSAIFILEVPGILRRNGAGDITSVQIFASAVLGTTTNIVSDYISLFVIRSWLVRYGTKPIFALISSSCIGLIIVNLATVLRVLIVMALTVTQLTKTSIPVSNPQVETMLHQSANQILLPLAFSLPAMLVFAWIPLLALGLLTIRSLNMASWALTKTQWIIKDGDKHPLTIVGIFAAILVFAFAGVSQTFFRAPPLLGD
jgi:hypothetical protein